MFLGEQMNHSETLQNEFKVYSIKTNIYHYYEKEELNLIVETGKLDSSFNKLILDNLKLYADAYIPKYSSAFANSKINGKLHLGVNDNGEITGVPYLGELKESDVTKLVENAKRMYVINNEVSTRVKIQKLKYNKHLITDETDEIIKKTNDHNRICQKITDDYYKERKKWVKEILKYTVKLSDIIRNPSTKENFYKYLKSKNRSMYNDIRNIKWEDIEIIKNKRDFIYDKESIIHDILPLGRLSTSWGKKYVLQGKIIP